MRIRASLQRRESDKERKTGHCGDTAVCKKRSFDRADWQEPRIKNRGKKRKPTLTLMIITVAIIICMCTSARDYRELSIKVALESGDFFHFIHFLPPCPIRYDRKSARARARAGD